MCHRHKAFQLEWLVRHASQFLRHIFLTYNIDHCKYVLSYAMIYTSRHKHTVHQATKPITR